MPILPKGSRHSIKYDEINCHVQLTEDLIAAYAFTDLNYPKRVIFTFLRKALDEFQEIAKDKWMRYNEDMNLNIKQISSDFKMYQLPEKVDKLCEAIK